MQTAAMKKRALQLQHANFSLNQRGMNSGGWDSYNRGYDMTVYTGSTTSSNMMGIEFSVEGITNHLQDPDGLKAYREFLSSPSQNYEQSVDFWQAVESIREDASDQDKLHRIGVIAERFVREDAPNGITLSAALRERFFNWLGVPDDSLQVLKEIQRVVCQQLRDKLIDYLDSRAYEEFKWNKSRVADEEKNEKEKERHAQYLKRMAEQAKTAEEVELKCTQYAHLLQSSSSSEDELDSWDDARVPSGQDDEEEEGMEAGEGDAGEIAQN